MAGGIKKFAVNHEALFQSVTGNKYHSNPNKAADSVPEAKGQGACAPDAAPAAATSPVAAPRSTPETQPAGGVTLRPTVRHPAPGVCPAFDQLAQRIGPQEAFKAIFGRAFEDYRALLDAGQIPTEPLHYETGRQSFRSMKVLSERQFRLVTATLNPDGLVPPAMLSRLVAEQALSLFFAKQRGADG